jgi:cytochrome c peroxidase
MAESPGPAAVIRSRDVWRWCVSGAVCLLINCRVSRCDELGTPPQPALAELGRQIFFDPLLSASGRMSCATCHDPAHAYGPPNGRAVQLGGPGLDREGARAVLSLRYVLNRTPAWSKEYISSPIERMIEPNEPPSGGFGWDGRFTTLRDQATFPLLSPDEMANTDAAQIAAKLAQAPYADRFRALFGEKIFNDPQVAFSSALAALERFELDDTSFRPYNSRYDQYLDGKVALTKQEQHGLALFDDPAAGNCAACHTDKKGADGSHPLFTDYQFEALGVPRNDELVSNASSGFYDAGICGPIRIDQADQQQYCGLFKTPTLRNVAIRKVFFHNGRFHDLRDALRFYVRRDTEPNLWYPVAIDGNAEQFNDLPPAQRGNIDVTDEPLTRHEGAAPAWSDADIEDVIAFLETLTDRDTIRATDR